MRRIKDLFNDIECTFINLNPDSTVKGLSSDSRLVKRGEIFVAVNGPEENGCDYINDAMRRGARAVCLDNPKKAPKKSGIILVNDASKVLPILASRVFGDPSKDLRIIGITGTNGKTTVSYLIYEILKAAGKSPSLLGTVAYKINEKAVEASNTTPGPMLLHSLFDKMRKEASDYTIMEVSSHALDQNRVFGIDFKIAVLTNITGDHLDYHKTMEDYAASKKRLFESLGEDGIAVINKDDGYYDYIKKGARARVIDYGIANEANFMAADIKSDINGSSFLIKTPAKKIRIETPLIGRHNIYNILAASCACSAEGIRLDIIKKAVGRFNTVPGRLEAADLGQPFKVFIDYAHTHDALHNVLSELRPLCKGSLVVVFGCGGDRDRTKRPKMAKIASKIADEIILTNDNPRTENPKSILDEIEKGIRRGFKNYKRIPDRFAAIKESLKDRQKSDVVIIAGKGHEDYQIIGRKRLPFSDRKAVHEILTRSTLRRCSV
jgi:UDP-N-acetylmuramoyl-L-alanyl-D-glutamate--2,6-diaminopimelate ligase